MDISSQFINKEIEILKKQKAVFPLADKFPLVIFRVDDSKEIKDEGGDGHFIERGNR